MLQGLVNLNAVKIPSSLGSVVIRCQPEANPDVVLTERKEVESLGFPHRIIGHKLAIPVVVRTLVKIACIAVICAASEIKTVIKRGIGLASVGGDFHKTFIGIGFGYGDMVKGEHGMWLVAQIHHSRLFQNICISLCISIISAMASVVFYG